MTIRVAIPDVGEDTSVLLPISMNQPLETGDRLHSILVAVKEKNLQDRTVILLCDYLNRHNTLDETMALQQGNEFLQQHKEMLTGFKIIRWKDFIDSKTEFFTAYLDQLNVLKSENSLFLQKITQTWKKCLKSQSLESSIKYQLEEYAAILCMQDFDYLVYPRKISDGMAFLYQYAAMNQIVIPKYSQIKISQLKAPVQGFFKQHQSPEIEKKQHIHIAFKGLLEHIDVLLDSKELSEESKKIFAETAQNLFLSKGLVEGIINTNTSSFPLSSKKDVVF